MAHTLTRCLTDGCEVRHWTTDGRRETCRDCDERAKRIRRMAVRLLKGSHPALGRMRECKVTVEGSPR